MAYVAAPDFPIKAIHWDLDRPSQANVSAWTGKRTVINDPWHGKWFARVELATLQGEEGYRQYRAFFARLKGSIGVFRLYATAGAQNENTGVTVASTAAVGATTMSITGYALGLYAGQFFTVNEQLCICTGDQSGGTLTFEPPLRQQATAGTTVVTSRPTALVYLSQSKFGWDIGAARRFGQSFDVEEAIMEAGGIVPEGDEPSTFDTTLITFDTLTTTWDAG